MNTAKTEGCGDFIWYGNISHLSNREALLVDDIKLSLRPKRNSIELATATTLA
jgi:hypothetical protein